MEEDETPLVLRAAEFSSSAALLAFGQPSEESLSLLARQLRAIREMLPLSCITGAPDLSIIIPPTLPQTCAVVLQNVSSCRLSIIFDTLWVLNCCAVGRDNNSLVRSIFENDCHMQLIRLLSHPELQVAERAVSLLDVLSQRDFFAATRLMSRPNHEDDPTEDQQAFFKSLVQLYNTVRDEATVDERGVPLQWKRRLVAKRTVLRIVAQLCQHASCESLRSCTHSFLIKVVREELDDSELLFAALWATSNMCEQFFGWRTEDSIRSGLLEACMSRLTFFQPNRHTTVNRQHDYVQETCVLPSEQLSGVFAFLNTSALRRVAFGCKDWFYDIVCHEANLYSRARAELTDVRGLGTESILHFLGSIVLGNDQQTEVVMQLGYLDIVDQLVQGDHCCCNVLDRKELCYSLSNVLADSEKRAQLVLAQPRIVAYVLATLQLQSNLDHNKVVEAVREAVFVVKNVCSTGEGVQQAVRCGMMHGVLMADRHVGMTPDMLIDYRISQLVSQTLMRLKDAVAGEKSARGSDLTDAASLFNEGITIFCHIAATARCPNNRKDSAVAYAIQTFPSAFADVRSYYYMLLLPFGAAMWFLNRRNTELIMEDDVEMIRKVLNQRSEEFGAARDLFMSDDWILRTDVDGDGGDCDA
ncbi:Hypothetical protein, putative [Bodo saltans]|uniref:Uncharacterized protein n=1 Tax=Bodo saltans TaxID=75058 RepID=A0A0S4JIU1_BODSA|nr:Hypothetical protein, putative [Bodo saltans]|eukprot:CUG90080.1 Hypothetical protein, putative [Bodo saltans]